MCSECDEESDYDEDGPTARKNDVYRLQMERSEVFEAQDKEKGHFDLALEIRGKKLYVHRYCLAAASETFNAMVSYRWSKNAEVIQIENPAYSYDDIYTLVYLIYSGKCTLTEENVFGLVDVAEYFAVSLLTKRCDIFLSRMDLVVEDLEKHVEFSERYSLARFQDSLRDFVPENFKAIFEAPDFLTHKKHFIEYLSTFTKQFFEEEDFFIAAFDWATFQALAASKDCTDEVFDFQGYMKEELLDVLPNIKHDLLNFKFVKEFILQNRFLFSVTQLYDIIASCQRENAEEEECFLTLHKVAKAEAKTKEETTIDENFSVGEVILEELAPVLTKINFHKMTIRFLTDFVVEQGFALHYFKLYSDLVTTRKTKNEEAFKTVYELARKQIFIKSLATTEPPICIADEVKKVLADVLPRVHFFSMDLNFLMYFVVPREIDFSLLLVYNYLIHHREIKGDKVYKKKIEDVFKSMYLLAQQRVWKKRETSLGLNIAVAIREELAEVLPRFNFHLMETDFLKNFVVEHGFSLPFFELHETLLNVKKLEKEDAFKIVYQLAEKQVLKKQRSSPVENFHLFNSVKEELEEVLDNVSFYLMEVKFLMDFVVEREISIPFEVLYDVLRDERHFEIEKAFKIIYRLAKKLVLQKQKTSPVADFNLTDAIKEELDASSYISFEWMEIEFLMDFVVEKGFTFSFVELYDTLVDEREFEKEEAFEAVYQLAEKQVLKMQKASPAADFKLIDAVKKELVNVIPKVEFRQMSYDFLMEFVVERGFFLTPSDFPTCLANLRQHYNQPLINQPELFTTIFKLAEKQVLQKKKSSSDENFNCYDTIRNELSVVCDSFDFAQMSCEFLMELVYKGLLFLSDALLRKYVSRRNYSNEEEHFKATHALAEKIALEKQKASTGKVLLSTTVFREIFLKCRRAYGNEEESFKIICELAEKQILKEQNGCVNGDFDIISAVKDVLIETIRVVKFSQMSKEFLDEFVFKNGIVSEEQTHQISYTCIKLANNNQTLAGDFQDIFDITRNIPVNGYYSTPRQWNKLRFSKLKFPIPSTPSVVQKMKGAEWFLCLEEDGILTVKHQSLISKTKDYLIAEMKADKPDFQLNIFKAACLTSSNNNV
uniref:BTB domain-containing protein n=1 Tax=Panagrolaimus sp. PS1159 TaxID=55785 RepID=A0AC35FCF2_9BILA